MSTNEAKRDPESGRVKGGNKLAVTHGGHSFLASGRLPSIRGKRRIAHELTKLREALLEAVPGGDDVRKRLLIGQILRAEGFALLVETHLRKYGLLRMGKGGLEAMPALSSLTALMNVQRQALLALGLDRQQGEAILAPYEIVADEQDIEKGKAKDAGGREQSDPEARGEAKISIGDAAACLAGGKAGDPEAEGQAIACPRASQGQGEGDRT